MGVVECKGVWVIGFEVFVFCGVLKVILVFSFLWEVVTIFWKSSYEIEQKSSRRKCKKLPEKWTLIFKSAIDKEEEVPLFWLKRTRRKNEKIIEFLKSPRA